MPQRRRHAATAAVPWWLAERGLAQRGWLRALVCLAIVESVLRSRRHRRESARRFPSHSSTLTRDTVLAKARGRAPGGLFT